MKNFITLKQRDEESRIDNTSRFKSARDVMVAQIGGPIELSKYMKERLMTDKKEAWECYVAFTFLDNADKKKYRSLVNSLVSQYSLGNDQYLSNHRFDSGYGEKKRSSNGSNTSKNVSTVKRDGVKQESQNPNLSFAQMEGKCYCCGKSGHKSPECRYNNKPKKEWTINRMKSSKEEKPAKKSVKWANAQSAIFSMAQDNKLFLCVISVTYINYEVTVISMKKQLNI